MRALQVLQAAAPNGDTGDEIVTLVNRLQAV
jgi:hypothetical protein